MNNIVKIINLNVYFNKSHLMNALRDYFNFATRKTNFLN